MTEPRMLIAGIGNIFLGDDGWGVEVVTRLSEHPLPDGVKVTDFGIRGLHLAYELLDGYDVVVLVDAVPMGEPPGMVALIEPEVPQLDEDQPVDLVDPHGMNPDVVLRMVAGLGGRVSRVFVVGCEPADLDEGIGLSPTVIDAVEPGVAMCRQLVEEVLHPLRK
jgi:hydrogenase maturation protease